MSIFILPGAVTLGHDALVRCDDQIVGRVIAIRENDSGINIGLQIHDKKVFDLLLYGGSHLVHASIPVEPQVTEELRIIQRMREDVGVQVEPVGDGLGWANENGCSSERQHCGGTYDPERGCGCV